MDQNQTAVLSALAGLAAQDPAIAVLWLYGSRAKGSASRASDYDLAVAFKDPAGPALERRLRPELLVQAWQDALGLPEGLLSAVDINLAPITLAHAIIRTGSVLQVNDTERLMQEERRITSMWEIDYQYHIKHYA